MKYRLSPREILRAEPEGFPEGSGDISSYTPTRVTIQLQSGVYRKERGNFFRTKFIPITQDSARNCRIGPARELLLGLIKILF